MTYFSWSSLGHSPCLTRCSQFAENSSGMEQGQTTVVQHLDRKYESYHTFLGVSLGTVLVQEASVIGYTLIVVAFLEPIYALPFSTCT